MSEKSRTGKAAVNAATSSVMQLMNIVLGFAGRTLFIRLLNSDYLGINSLFSNILTVLSFAELGIGSAIAFSLYKPIAEKDISKIQALMKFYRKAYWYIGSIILLLGLCVIPFLDVVIKDAPNIKENLGLIYVLFLFNTTVSYFFGYKKTLITADQKDYVVQIYTRIFQLIQILAQSFFLYITHEYLIYLVIHIFCTILLNVSLSLRADKIYPCLTERNDNSLSREETKSIFDNVKALFVYKLGSVVLNGTDNIIISSVINVGVVGITSNYMMLINNVTNVVGGAISSLTASVGNLSVRGSKAQIRKVMHELLLICVWSYGFVAIGFAALANDFVYLWLGDKWLLEQHTVIAILFSLYINGVQYAAYTFRTTQGLFVQSKWLPMISAIMNIILSIWWGKVIGVTGIFAATGISRLLTTTVVDPWLVYKNNFNTSPCEYYMKYFAESVGVMANALIQIWLVRMIPLSGWSGFLIKGAVLCITINAVFFLEFGWTKDFKGLLKRILLRFGKGA